MDKQWLEEQARQTRFVKRRGRKLTALLFVQAALLLVGQRAVSLRGWAVLLGVLGNLSVSKQSVWERLGKEAVKFFERVLARVLAQRAKPVRCSGVLSAFERVWIQDSTCIRLPARLAKAFPGSSNQLGVRHGQLKIQATYELHQQRFARFSFSGFNRNDQAASGDVLGVLKAGDLVLRDLGYFVLEVLNEIANQDAFFLSRIRLDVPVFDPGTGQPINLLGRLRKQHSLDLPVQVGAQRVKARLVAIRLPDAVAAERRRKARANRDRRCQPSRRYLTLLGWAIFVTNVPRNQMSPKQVAEVYGLRWQIETLFKTWKSHFAITKVPHGSREQLLVVIYARLILISLLAPLCQPDWHQPWRPDQRPSRSVLKATEMMADFILALFLQLWQPNWQQALSLQLDYHCNYESRSRINFIEKLMKLS